jgi:uncharacterized protein YbjT (DUF2867 family)
MKKIEKVLVVGATGQQGGRVARRLLEGGRSVRALTRKPKEGPALALAALGAEVVSADLDDAAAVDAAVRGVDAVFSVATPFERGLAAETRNGITVADAARAAGAFLVYSSVANADRQTNIPHFDSKLAVERHIREKVSDAAILAPVYFMENVRFVRAQLKDGVYPSPLPPGRALAQIATDDIAAAALAIFEDPARHAGKRYDLGGDELTGEASRRILSEVLGRDLTYAQLPLEVVRGALGEDAAIMYAWFERVGYTVDRAALARDFPDVRWTSFERWARGYDWKSLLGGQG